jgi:hypothetical protein
LRLPTVPEREIPPTTTHPYQVATCCSIWAQNWNNNYELGRGFLPIGQ